MTKVYICSPYRAPNEKELQENIELAKRVCRSATMTGYTVLCPHLLYPQFLDDNDEEEREAGIQAGLELLETADEVWVVSGRISTGMAREIARAGELGIPTKCVIDPLVVEEHLLNTIVFRKDD